jgi:N-acetylneuraminic acid mutarotase
VFLLSVDDDLLRIEDWPDLPVPLTSAGAARIESTIYLAGA